MSDAPRANHDPGHERLRPVLGLTASVALVIGCVIGSGIFITPSEIAEATQENVGLILGLWVVVGLVILCGALALAELSAMMPHSGGQYLFLREAFGGLWAFTWAWTEFWVIRSGSNAALAAAMARNLEATADAAGMEFSRSASTISAVTSIVVLTVLNIASARWGGAVQTATTAIRVAFILFLAMLPFMAVSEEPIEVEHVWPSAVTTSLLVGIGGAITGILWTYDGWAMLPIVAEEVENPERNVPRALFLGMAVLILLYFGANLAYHITLPASEIVVSKVPAADAADRLLPTFGGISHFGQKLTLAMMAVSVFGALSANILAGPRVFFAAGRDHHWLGPLRRVDPRFGTPAIAIGLTSLWSVMLILAAEVIRGDEPLFDVLIQYCIFGASLFYLASVVAVFVLRRKQPDAPRPYRAWGYPVLPALFVVAFALCLASMFVSSPRECLYGLGLIVSGMVVYGVAWALTPRQRS